MKDSHFSALLSPEHFTINPLKKKNKKLGATEQGNLSPVKEGYEQTQAQRLAKEWKGLKTVENEKDSLKSITSVNVQTPISVHLCLFRGILI